jgi:hypothetical protein
LVTRSFIDRNALYAHVDGALARLRRCSPAAFGRTKATIAEIWAGPPAQGLARGKEAAVGVLADHLFVEALRARKGGMVFDFVDNRAIARDD